MADAPDDLVTLTAESAVLAEVTVLDNKFQIVGRGPSPLSLSLRPGMYVVTFKLGSSMSEVTAVLRPGRQEVVVQAPNQELPSPAPLGATVAATQYKAFARSSSLSIDGSAGAGGQLFLFVRAANADRDRSDLASLFDITVLDASGAPAIQFATAAHRAPDGLSAALNVGVAPGNYLIRYRAGAVGCLEQTVVVCEGWQTQVFSSSRLYTKLGEEDRIGPNLPDAAVFMAPAGAGFDPDGAGFASAESARQALGEDCSLVPVKGLREVSDLFKTLRASSVTDAEIRQMAGEKFRNPMGGLYAAHLMLLRPTRDTELLKEVVANLRTILGNHPDVMALEVLPEVGRPPGEAARTTVPPMLRSSWKLLLSGSVTDPDLIPRDSYAIAVADRMWGKSTWQVWRAPRPEDLVPRDPAEVLSADQLSAAVAQLQTYVLGLVRAQGSTSVISSVARDTSLTPTERAVMMLLVSTIEMGNKMQAIIDAESGTLKWLGGLVKSHLGQFTWTDFLTGLGNLSPDMQKQLTVENIARSLHIPLNAVSASVASLARKVTERSAALTH
jgi:hypothetical protein